MKSNFSHRNQLRGSVAPCALILAIAGSSLMTAPPVLAQPSTGPAEEVIVTARRKEEKLQDVPVAVAAFSQQELEAKNITKISNLQTVAPGFSASYTTDPSTLTLTVRANANEAANPGQDAAVPIYFNEMPASVTYGLNLALFDLESVQVLKGPQGTLFGRNSTGGAVLLATAKPTDDFTGYLKVGGQFHYNGSGYSTEGMLNVPVNDYISVRAAFSTLQRDPLIENVTPREWQPFFSVHRPPAGPLNLPLNDFEDFGDESNQAWRFSMRFRNDKVDNNLVYQGTRAVNNGRPGSMFAANPAGGGAATVIGIFAPAGAPRPVDSLAVRQASGNFWSTITAVDTYTRVYTHFATNTTEVELADNLTLKNIFGYHFVRHSFLQDFNGQPFHLISSPITQKGGEFTEELQLQGTSFNGTMNWVAGLFAGTNTFARDSSAGTIIALATPQWTRFNVVTRTYAGFVNAEQELPFLEGLKVNGGIRYNYDHRDAELHSVNSTFNDLNFTSCRINNDTVTPAVPLSLANCAVRDSEGWASTTWQAGISYQPVTDTLIYLMRRRGFLSGGYSRQATTLKAFRPFNPEIVNDWEVGLKRDWYFNDVFLRTNLALFRQKNTDAQRRVLDPNDVSIQTVINAASATTHGAEFAMTLRPFEGLNIDASYTWIDAGYDKFIDGTTDVSGLKFADVSKHTYSVGARYQLPLAEDVGDVFIGGDWAWRSEFYFDNISQRVGPTQVNTNSGYGVANFRVDWQGVMGSSFDLSGFVTNAFNTEQVVDVAPLWSSFGYQLGYLNEPRIFGVEAKYSF